MGPLNRFIIVLSFFWVVNNCKGFEGSTTNENCCSPCHCSGSRGKNLFVDCSNRRLSEMPRCPWSNVTKLDLTDNNFSDLPDMSIVMENLKELHLERNKLTKISSVALSKMPNLEILDLSYNNLSCFLEGNITMKNLRELHLEDNQFTKMSADTLSKMPNLQSLDLSSNHMSDFQEPSITMKNLEVLFLGNNDLTKVSPGVFSRMPNLNKLDLSNNHLSDLPEPNVCMENLDKLYLQNNKFSKIPVKTFSKMPNLYRLEMSYNKIESIPTNALWNMNNLEFLILHANHIRDLSDDLCNHQKHLSDLDLNDNKLEKIPILRNCSSLAVLKMDDNKVDAIEDSLNGMKNLLDVTIKRNKIRTIGEEDFYGLKRLETLLLSGNGITSIHENAFASFEALNYLDLEDNKFPYLPTKGLQSLERLIIRGNTKLTNFPSPSHFPHIRTLELQYPYHCCFFLHREAEREDSINNPLKGAKIMSWTWLSANSSDSSLEHPEDDDDGKHSGSIFLPSSPSESISCEPHPDAFFPCSDLMGNWFLRCGVWFVFLLALTGNATVVIVILASHTKIDVSRFLISNLAFADLFMGIYLGFLAVVDVSTLGNFKSYGLEWQMSAGCQTAGFLAVLSSELSVFTLTVITLERYIAIKNAIRINRKLELKTAVIVMAIGWVFAITTASLPLLHISSYAKFSVCLPFEAEDTKSTVFLAFLLCLNACAFLVILCCYILMYCSIQGSNAWNASDIRVAKRMALLVVTDFLCWAPIVFLSLTAAFGTTLVSLDQAKIFTVFVFPLNSCANPFLYAIFTAHFKKDLVSICRRVEDKYPFLKITKQKLSFSRRSSYSGAISENHNINLRIRRFSLPVSPRGFHNSVVTHEKGGSSASSNSNNKSAETNAAVRQSEPILTERETSL